MNLHLIYVFALGVCLSGSSASEPYGKCEKFEVDEIKPFLPNGDRFCITWGQYEYCKSYKCPKPECTKPLTPNNGACLYCQGTCSYGGSVYKVGDGFVIPSMDGVNKCGCMENNAMACTKIGSNPERMCLSKTPLPGLLVENRP